jgi:hypothetical protein
MVACLLAAGLVTTGTRAVAAIPTRVDVGVTINDQGVWKGSGSYSNGDGSFTSFCVQIRQDRPGPDSTLSSRCEATPVGSQAEFSAPDVACFNKYGWLIYTRAIALNAAGGIVASRSSGRIPHTC